MNNITFPMSIDYLSSGDNAWCEWDIVRELFSNALDCDPNATLWKDADNTLFIWNKTGELKPEHLMLGVSMKDSPTAIGQFGEGMKVALMVLTRMGMTAYIHSGNLMYWNTMGSMFAKPVLKMVWAEQEEVTEGTLIRIPEWNYPIFAERFIRAGDDRVAFTDMAGRQILRQDDPDIFVKGVWVCKAALGDRRFAFGYNLIDIPMNRDRKIADMFHVRIQAGSVWGNVEDAELLELFFTAIKIEMVETELNLYSMRKQVAKQAFKAVFGANTVVATDSSKAREATYLGAKTINVGYGLRQALGQIAGTDEEFLAEERASRPIVPVKKSEIRKDAVTNLTRLVRLAKKVDPAIQVIPVMTKNTEGMAQWANKIVMVEVRHLDDWEESVNTLIHEIGHVITDGAPDGTPAHTEGCCKAAAKIIAGGK